MLWKIILCLTLLYNVQAYPSGAPSQTCDSLRPSHGVEPQTSLPPFTITVNGASTISPGQTVDLTLSGAPGFQGFIIVALANGQRVGEFTKTSPMTRVTCDDQRGLTHTTEKRMSDLAIQWMAPPSFSGKVTFIGTFVENYRKFWVAVRGSQEVEVVAQTPSNIDESTTVSEIASSTTQGAFESTTPAPTKQNIGIDGQPQKFEPSSLGYDGSLKPETPGTRPVEPPQPTSGQEFQQDVSSTTVEPVESTQEYSTSDSPQPTQAENSKSVTVETASPESKSDFNYRDNPRQPNRVRGTFSVRRSPGYQEFTETRHFSLSSRPKFSSHRRPFGTRSSSRRRQQRRPTFRTFRRFSERHSFSTRRPDRFSNTFSQYGRQRPDYRQRSPTRRSFTFSQSAFPRFSQRPTRRSYRRPSRLPTSSNIFMMMRRMAMRIRELERALLLARLQRFPAPYMGYRNNNNYYRNY